MANRQKAGHLNPNIPSAEMSHLMTTAAGQMKTHGLRLLTPQLLLSTFLDEKQSVAHQILQKLAGQRGFDWTAFVKRVETMAKHTPGRPANFKFTDDFGKDVPLADELLITVDEALTIAQTRDEIKVTSGHALAAMAANNVTTYGVLQRIGVTQAAVIALLDQFAQDGNTTLIDHVSDAKAGTITPLYERDNLLNDMRSLLALSSGRHIILVGAEGAGKRTLARSLALSVTDSGQFRSLVEINEAALLEDPLAAMRAGLRRATHGILLVPSIQRWFPGRSRATFPSQVSRELQKAILGDEITVIGTATTGDYDLMRDETLIKERTNRIDVPQATKEETIEILKYHKPRLEQEYGLTVQVDSIDKAAQLAGQYMKTTALPGAAVQLADRACALVKMAGEGVVKGVGEDPVSADKVVSVEDIMIAASQITKVPMNKLGEDESSRYANMVEALHKRIIGQDEAVMAVSRAVKIARVGLRKPKRPIGSFLFLGPSGVGKTELAKALAEFMFGSEKAMIVLDMSEYQDEASVNRMIGSPPGYIGSEEGGQLTNFVRETPYTVVLLDEIEKAHPRVLDVLLQVLEEGRLTDGKGRVTTFSETVVIMTSNIGAYHMMVPVIGETERGLVMEDVFKHLRPEFINRIDDVILFHQLTPDQLAKILDLMLRGEFKLTSAQGINLQLTNEAKTYMLAQNDQPEFGARPLRRIIQKHLREPLADYILANPGAKTAAIVVDASEDGLVFNSDE